MISNHESARKNRGSRNSGFAARRRSGGGPKPARLDSGGRLSRQHPLDSRKNPEPAMHGGSDCGTRRGRRAPLLETPHGISRTPNFRPGPGGTSAQTRQGCGMGAGGFFSNPGNDSPRGMRRQPGPAPFFRRGVEGTRKKAGRIPRCGFLRTVEKSVVAGIRIDRRSLRGRGHATRHACEHPGGISARRVGGAFGIRILGMERGRKNDLARRGEIFRCAAGVIDPAGARTRGC